jgi:ATP-dependent Clp protease ATP-binding subunit ClpB
MDGESGRALQTAQSLAAQYNHQEIDVEHLLLALVAAERRHNNAALAEAGSEYGAMLRETEQELARRPKQMGVESGRL